MSLSVLCPVCGDKVTDGLLEYENHRRAHEFGRASGAANSRARSFEPPRYIEREYDMDEAIVTDVIDTWTGEKVDQRTRWKDGRD